jgi:YfiH family protein
MDPRLSVATPPPRRVAPLMIRNPAWDALDWLRVASTTRPFAEGARDKHEVAERLAAELTGDPAARVWGEQCHSDGFQWVDDAIIPPAGFPETDAIATARPGLTLACFTADCVPIVVVDVAERVIGTAHAGWRGTFAGIGARLVREMVARGSRPQSLEAWIAPAISGAVYEVSPELAADFAAKFPQWAGEIVRGRLLDLPRLNALMLEGEGLAPEKIARTPHCTYSDAELFFSYRRDGKCGPQLCAGAAILAR